MLQVLRTAWSLARQSVVVFIDDGALSRGAAIAFYAITSIGPILLIVVSVVGVAYGEQAARGVLIGKLAGFMGRESADFLQSAIGSAWRHGNGTFPTIIGIVSLLLTATGLFSEMQAALNAIWNITPPAMTVWLLVRDRLLGLALVLGLALMLFLVVIVSAVLNAMESRFQVPPAVTGWFFHGISILLSVAVLTLMVGAVYKVLPDTYLRWRDVGVGALVTAVLLTIGKMLIGLYLGRTGIASSYGAAGSVIVVMLWIYYSSEIFLLGAQFTNIYAEYRRETKRSPAGSAPPNGRVSARPNRISPQEHSQ